MLTPRDREAFLLRIDRLIWKIAGRHHPPQPLDTDDLHQEGVLAVWQLLGRWTSGTDAHLVNASCLRANGAMVDAIRAARWAGRANGGLDSEYETPASLEWVICDDAGRQLRIGDTITEPGQPLDLVDAMQAWHRLNDRRRAEMMLQRAAGYSMMEIGEWWGVSESRVSQLLSRADTMRRIAA